MRILHILDHSLPLHSGYSFRTAAILREQQALGWETFHVTTPRHRAACEPCETVDGLTFYRTPYTAGWRSRVPAAGAYLDEMHATRSRLDELVQKFKPDILHAHSPVLTALPALRIARRMEIPLVYEVRALWEDGAVDHGTTRPGSLRYRTTRLLETFVLKRAAHVTTICAGLANEISSRGIRSNRVTVIPNAVDTAEFSFDPPADAALRERLGLSGTVVLGFIGSFYGYEGLECLLDAFAGLARRRPDIRLVFVGGGLREEALKSRAERHGVTDLVRFVGRVSHDEIARYYSIIDLLIYPRLPVRLTELVTPLKPLEAMAQGRILIASDVGGHRELIREGETGFLFRAGSVEDLMATVERVLGDSAASVRVRERARRFVESERTWKLSVAKYAAAYAMACERNSAPPAKGAMAIREIRS